MASENKQKVRKISYENALKFAIYLGWIGADRFYIGDIKLGVLKALSLSGYGVFWVADIAVIKSHESDWDTWIAAKQAKRAAKKAKAQAIKERQQEVARRKANGQCPICGSSNLTAVSETTNKLSTLGAIVQLGNPSKYIPNDKIVSVTKRVCLNCGFKF